jgi:hypothetical protein
MNRGLALHDSEIFQMAAPVRPSLLAERMAIWSGMIEPKSPLSSRGKEREAADNGRRFLTWIKTRARNAGVCFI